jgi:hypothetical protein
MFPTGVTHITSRQRQQDTAFGNIKSRVKTRRSLIKPAEARGGSLLVSPVRIGGELHDKACAIDAVRHSCADHLSSMRASGPYQTD